MTCWGWEEMGAGGKELRKVTDKSRAERGWNLQSQVKSKRRGGNPGDIQREKQGENGRGWALERKEQSRSR